MNILIIGAGDIGFQLAKRLSTEKHDIVMIELDPQKVMRASEQLDAFVIEGSGASYGVLQQANLNKIEIVAAMTDHDEVNLMACRLAKKAGVPTTIARVRNSEFTKPDFILTPQELGTDLIIHPEKETAEAVVQLIHQACATYAVELEQGKIQVLGVVLEKNSPLLNIPLADLGRRYGHPLLRIVAIDRNHKTLIPRGHDQLVSGDQVFVVCDHDYTSKFIALTGKKDTRVRNVMILGGGLIGRFIATNLAKEANVKIIEGNEKRAQRIAETLPHTLIIHGDGTDFDLLHSEGLTDMDAFVAVTGDDENNIITTLLARKLNIPRVIALVNKVEYLSVTPTIGVDAVVSKQLLTVNAVQRFVRQQQVASIVSLPGVDAQIIEYIAHERSRITCQVLKDIRFPRHALVGAVLREEKLIIPHGDTQIQPKDKVVVFTLPQDVHKLDRLFC